VLTAGRYVSQDTWYDAAGHSFEPRVHYFVGGATKLYGAAQGRLRPADFGEIVHMDGLSPAWPLSYDEFEPWYAKAEWLYQARGLHGEDPTEGPWSEEYPWPPVSHEPLVQQIADDLDRAGYDPFHVPRGIMLDEANPPTSLCLRCDTCDGYPCLAHAKADTGWASTWCAVSGDAGARIHPPWVRRPGTGSRRLDLEGSLRHRALRGGEHHGELSLAERVPDHILVLRVELVDLPGRLDPHAHLQAS